MLFRLRLRAAVRVLRAQMCTKNGMTSTTGSSTIYLDKFTISRW